MTEIQQQTNEQSGPGGRFSLILPPFRSLRPKVDELATVPAHYANFYKKIKARLSRKEVAYILRVYRFADRAHTRQLRSSGEPYINHPIIVAGMVADLRLDTSAIAAALLHDVIEDTTVSLENIKKEFGEEVAFLVEGLTKLRSIKKKSIQTRGIASLQSANYQKLVMAMARDLRVILIKFSDRLHNLQTIEALPADRRRRIAKETMLIYAPLAGRLGMEKLRMQLEDLSFATVYPLRYKLLKNEVEKARDKRKDYLQKVIKHVRSCMKKKGITCEVYGRRKNLTGIYLKMTRRSSEWLAPNRRGHESSSLHEIMDVYGVRIIVKKIDDCYSALGALHVYMRPIAGRFKDYIANPKKNGYQSLHTTLVGQNGYPLEVQIRTHEMNLIAEAGIAAHFLYKAGLFKRKNKNEHAEKSVAWLRSLAVAGGEGRDLIQQLDKEFNTREIYVYTPVGEVINLPVGACAVDFAYAVHTDMGAKCVACTIDNRPASITQPLQTGQVVKIETRTDAAPDFSWSSYAVTPKALSHIAQYARMQESVDMRVLGEKMLTDALHAYKPKANLKDISSDKWYEYLNKHGLPNRDSLYESLCTGKMAPLVVAFSLLPGSSSAKVANEQLSLGVRSNNSAMKYTNCCHPIPGDNIIAVPIKPSGLHIHRLSCPNVTAKSESLPAHWENEDDDLFLAAIRCYTKNMPDAFSKVVTLLARNNVNVESIVTENDSVATRVLVISVWVRNRVHFNMLIRKLKLMRDITAAERIRG